MTTKRVWRSGPGVGPTEAYFTSKSIFIPSLKWSVVALDSPGTRRQARTYLPFGRSSTTSPLLPGSRPSISPVFSKEPSGFTRSTASSCVIDALVLVATNFVTPAATESLSGVTLYSIRATATVVAGAFVVTREVEAHLGVQLGGQGFVRCHN